MNILLVGGAGYIGSQVAHDLVRQPGFQPIVLDNLSTGHAASLPVGVKLVRGSYGNRSVVEKVLKQYKIGAVMHFGAKLLVAESVRFPELYWKANVEDTRQLLLGMLNVGVKQVIVSSTAAVYGQPQGRLISEAHPLDPISPYGRSKLAMEFLIQDFAATHGFTGAAVRYFNAAGADDSGNIGEDHEPETHLIPTIMRQALGLIPFVPLYGDDYATPDGSCIRDYVDVRDISRAHLLLLQKKAKLGKKWSTYNLGSGKGFSVWQVIKTARRVTKQPIPVRVRPRRVGDPVVLVASSAGIRQAVGWKPEHTLRDMLASAWRWHSTHPQGY